MEVVYLLGFCFFACLLLLCLSSVFSFPGFVCSLMFKQYVQFHRFVCSHMMLNPVCQGSCAHSQCSVQFNKVYVLTHDVKSSLTRFMSSVIMFNLV